MLKQGMNEGRVLVTAKKEGMKDALSSPFYVRFVPSFTSFHVEDHIH